MCKIVSMIHLQLNLYRSLYNDHFQMKFCMKAINIYYYYLIKNHYMLLLFGDDTTS